MSSGYDIFLSNDTSPGRRFSNPGRDILQGKVELQVTNPYADSRLFGGTRKSMENYCNQAIEKSTESGSVRCEVIGFFRANPFLLVNEGRLASLLCRPREMVREAVEDLERAGLLTRRFGEALLGVEEALARSEP